MSRSVVLVTGGAGVIGRAITQAMIADGWRVVCLDRAGAIDQLEHEEFVTPLACDITDHQQLASIVAQCGELAALVNCAGIVEFGPLMDTDLESWRRTFEVNVTAPFALIRLAAPALARSGRGAIVNITSITARRASVGRAAYGPSKAALEGLTRQAAVELAPLGIRCNAVAPGPVESPLSIANLSAKDYADYVASIPSGRFSSAAEVADAVAYLCSGCAGSVTGQCLAVDGGWLAAGAGMWRLRETAGQR